MYNRRIIEGRRGDDVLTWWRAVLTWLQSLPVVIGPNVVATQTPMGLKAIVRTENPVNVFFEVGVSEGKATILPGQLDGYVPYIEQRDGKEKWVRLDGILPDQTGNVPLDTRPVLDLSEAKPGDDGRSAICLVVKVDEFGRPLDPKEAPENLRVEHRSDFSGNAKRAAGEKLEPFIELAIVYWRDARAIRSGQNVTHNLKLFKSAEENVFYFAAV